MVDFCLFCDKCAQRARDKGIEISPLTADEMKQRNLMWYSKYPELERENRELKIKMTIQQQDLESVQWYIDVLEKGKDTRKLAKLYSTTSTELKALKQKHA